RGLLRRGHSAAVYRRAGGPPGHRLGGPAPPVARVEARPGCRPQGSGPPRRRLRADRVPAGPGPTGVVRHGRHSGPLAAPAPDPRGTEGSDAEAAALSEEDGLSADRPVAVLRAVDDARDAVGGGPAQAGVVKKATLTSCKPWAWLCNP